MKRSTLDLSIIIASYNTRQLLRECLDSVYRHTRDISFEVICVDDQSSDGSADMVMESFPEVILVRNRARMRYARNHNVGTRIASGRYACHLDSDTFLSSDAVSEMVRFMDEHPDVSACGPKLLNADGGCPAIPVSLVYTVSRRISWYGLPSRALSSSANSSFSATRIASRAVGSSKLFRTRSFNPSSIRAQFMRVHGRKSMKGMGIARATASLSIAG